MNLNIHKGDQINAGLIKQTGGAVKVDQDADAWLAQNLGIKIDDFMTGDMGEYHNDRTDFTKMMRPQTGINRGISNSGLTAANKQRLDTLSARGMGPRSGKALSRAQSAS